MKKFVTLFAGAAALGAAAASAQTTIDFDDVAAPCVFAQTIALRDEYSRFGVYFSGGANLDGGAILNQCGGFSINARSGENFLAYNRGSRLSDGGIPRDPQFIKFDPMPTRVELYVSGGSAQGRFLLEAFDDSGAPVDSDGVVSGNEWVRMSVSNAAGIRWVEFTETGGRNVFLIDDLTIDTGGGCYPDCDGNGVLDFFDFLCFQNAFLAGDPYADCDGNQVLDFFDFLCFQNEFLAGCP